MAVAVLALAAALVATIAVFAGLLRWVFRAHDRERHTWGAEHAQLVNQVCHLAGKTWTQPPRRPTLREPEGDDDLIADVDQLAD